MFRYQILIEYVGTNFRGWQIQRKSKTIQGIIQDNISKILKAEIGNGIGKVGEVISNNLEIACGNNQSIKILEIQREGKKPQKIGEFMLGSQIKKGSIISNV